MGGGGGEKGGSMGGRLWWGGSPVVYPAEPLSPGVRMTGSQPDGTEQVSSM